MISLIKDILIEDKIQIPLSDWDKVWAKLRMLIKVNSGDEKLNSSKEELSKLEKMSIEEFARRYPEQELMPDDTWRECDVNNEEDRKDFIQSMETEIRELKQSIQDRIDQLTNLEFEKRYKIK